MDIGKHCAFCRQIDFLPFVCEDCSKTFCANHRHREQHNCSGAKVEFQKRTPSPKSGGKTAAQLFEEAKEPKRYEQKNNNTTLGSVLKSDSLGGLAALEKVRRFVVQQGKSTKKKGTNIKGFKGFFKSNATERIVMVSKLKSEAKGDSKVPVSERVYCSVIVVPDGDQDYAKYFGDKKHLASDFQKPFFMSRSWPVGRALDSFTTIYKIKNVNNKAVDHTQKLELFRLTRAEERASLKSEDDLVVPVAANGRVNKELKDGDTLYLIRGYA